MHWWPAWVAGEAWFLSFTPTMQGGGGALNYLDSSLPRSESGEKPGPQSGFGVEYQPRGCDQSHRENYLSGTRGRTWQLSSGHTGRDTTGMQTGVALI